MADRLYFGSDCPREWLEAQRRTLQLARAQGKRVTMIIAAFVKTEAHIEVSVGVALRQIEHDLCKRFPQDYDASELMPVKRTRPRYLFGA